MARILITSGPTRQYIDPVRFLSNASSGRMGAAIARAAIRAGHEVIVVSGPVEIAYPKEARVIPVMTTSEMLTEAERYFPTCDGVIGVAAPCDYRPNEVSPHKLSKTGKKLVLSFVETPDIIATLGNAKRSDQWVVGFALETDDPRLRAVRKMVAKNCDMLVLNGPSVISSTMAEVEILKRPDVTVMKLCGSKQVLGRKIFQMVEKTLIQGNSQKKERP